MFVPESPVNNIPALVQIMASRRLGDMQANISANDDLAF